MDMHKLIGKVAKEDLEENDMELEEMMRLSGLNLNEKAPPTAKGERMVKHIKKGYAKDGKLTKKEKSIAYATAWKQHNKEKVNEGMDIMLDEDGHTLKHIVNRFKHETKNFMNTGFMAENLYDALYDYYLDRGDMPYGIAKAREGDPYQWVEERFYQDMGSEMSENVVAEETVDSLSELARLAGLEEAISIKHKRNPGSPAPEIGSNLPKSDTETFGLDPSKGYKIEPAKDWKPGDKKRDIRQLIPTQDKKDHIRSRLGKHVKPAHLPESAINECGDMGMDQHDTMNVSTNMSSDGTKNVTISAQGNKADELLSMLKLAGMHHHHHEEPEIVLTSGDEEMMEDTHSSITLALPLKSAIEKLQVNGIEPGLRRFFEFARDNGAVTVDDAFRIANENPRYSIWAETIQSMIGDEELDEADRVTQYANTPEEEYETVDTIIRQGNDLNREKRQYADKPKLGDNPMAESILDQDLNDILESVLIRENDNPKIEKDEKTGRVRATFEPPKKEKAPDQSKLPLQNEPYHGPRSLKVDGEKTGTEKEVDEGWEDVSNFVGDLVGTEASKLRGSQQLRDLDAMRKQYKGTPYEKQVQDRYDMHLNRLQADKGEVVGKDGEPIKVLPPEQWKGGK